MELGAAEGIIRAVVEHYIGPGDAHFNDIAKINYTVVVSVDFITAIEEVIERCVVGGAEGKA